MKKPDNKEARVMGILNFATLPSVASATAAAMEFAVDAHYSGHALSSLAVLMNKSDPTSVNVTLARRHYWRSVAPEQWPPDALTRLAAQDDRNSLLVLIAHDECDSHLVLTIGQMQKALG